MSSTSPDPRPNSPKWKKFEHLVADVQSHLSPGARVVHNERIRGVDSGELRQVDVAIHAMAGQFPMLVAMDCKDLAEPVDVKDVEAFIGLAKDIRANKGVIVSARGFTGTAKKVGLNAGIDLLRLIDTGEHEWRAVASIPVLCDYRSPKRYSLTLTLPPDRLSPVTFTSDPPGAVIPDDLNLIANAGEILKRRWNEGKLPDSPGVHHGVEFTEGPLWLRRGTSYREALVLATVEVEQQLFIGSVRLSEASGFRNENTGKAIVLRLQTGPLDVQEVLSKWRRLSSRDELSLKPVIEVLMHDVLPLEAGQRRPSPD